MTKYFFLLLSLSTISLTTASVYADSGTMADSNKVRPGEATEPTSVKFDCVYDGAKYIVDEIRCKNICQAQVTCTPKDGKPKITTQASCAAVGADSDFCPTSANDCVDDKNVGIFQEKKPEISSGLAK